MAKLEPESQWVATKVIQTTSKCVSDEVGRTEGGRKYQDSGYILKALFKSIYGWLICRQMSTKVPS